MCKLNNEDSEPKQSEKLAHITSIAVDSAYRGLGLGSLLMEKVLD